MEKQAPSHRHQPSPWRRKLRNLSLIACTRNREPQVAPFCRALLPAFDHLFEIILVYYGFLEPSHEDASNLLNPKLTLVGVPEAMSFWHAHARNIGLKAATGDIVLFADIDHELPPAFIREAANLPTNSYLVAAAPPDTHGVVALERTVALDVRGFEEACTGYGYEDMHFRIMLQRRHITKLTSKTFLPPITLGTNSRDYETKSFSRTASINHKICRTLEMKNGTTANIDRTWGAGGIIYWQASHERQ